MIRIRFFGPGELIQGIFSGGTGAGEEDQRVQCIDDITGKEFVWSEVRQAREQEFTHLRDVGVYEKVAERGAIAKYQVTPDDTRWIDTNEAFEWESMQIMSRIVAREFRSGDRHAGTPPLEALMAIIIIAANHRQTFCTSTCHVRIFTHSLRDLCWYVCKWLTEWASALETWIVE